MCTCVYARICVYRCVGMYECVCVGGAPVSRTRNDLTVVNLVTDRARSKSHGLVYLVTEQG